MILSLYKEEIEETKSVFSKNEGELKLEMFSKIQGDTEKTSQDSHYENKKY